MSIDDSSPDSAPHDRLQFNLKFLLATVLGFSVLLAVVVHAFQLIKDSARGTDCTNLHKEIGIAFYVYDDIYGRFPAAFVPDESNARMHSWRYSILPYLESGPWSLYDMSVPWNAPVNLEFSNRFTPPYYFCPFEERSEKGKGVNKVMVVGAETAAPGFPGRSRDDFADGLANTLLMAEIADSDIRWTEPRDLEFDHISFQINDRAAPSISSHHPGGAVVMMADGSVRFLSDDTDPGLVRDLLTVAGDKAAPP